MARYMMVTVTLYYLEYARLAASSVEMLDSPAVSNNTLKVPPQASLMTIRHPAMPLSCMHAIIWPIWSVTN